MLWCPICLTEYDLEGVTTCANCHVPLVDELPPQPQVKQKSPARDIMEPVLLITVDDMVEADMLLGLMNERRIPAFKKICGAGDVIVGGNPLGLEIYVPRKLLMPAREIVEDWLLLNGEGNPFEGLFDEDMDESLDDEDLEFDIDDDIDVLAEDEEGLL